MVRRLALLPLVVVLSAAAAGWLYLLEPGLPGPRIAEALPLDELSRHDRAPLLWFVVVWGTVAVLLGLYARWAAARAGDRSTPPRPRRGRLRPPRDRAVGRRRAPGLDARRARDGRANEGRLPALRRSSPSRPRCSGRGAARPGQRLSSPSSSPWPQRSTCSTRSFPVRTRASCGRSPRTRSARSRVLRAPWRRSRCSPRHAASRAGAVAAGRWRPPSPGSRPFFTSCTG